MLKSTAWVDHWAGPLLCVTLLLGGDSLETNMHISLPSLYIRVYLTEPWWLSFPDTAGLRDKQSQSWGVGWLLNSLGASVVKPSNPSSLSNRGVNEHHFYWSRAPMHMTEWPLVLDPRSFTGQAGNKLVTNFLRHEVKEHWLGEVQEYWLGEIKEHWLGPLPSYKMDRACCESGGRDKDFALTCLSSQRNRRLSNSLVGNIFKFIKGHTQFNFRKYILNYLNVNETIQEWGCMYLGQHIPVWCQNRKENKYSWPWNIGSVLWILIHSKGQMSRFAQASPKTIVMITMTKWHKRWILPSRILKMTSM